MKTDRGIRLLGALIQDLAQDSRPGCRRWAVILGRFLPVTLDIETRYPSPPSHYVAVRSERYEGRPIQWHKNYVLLPRDMLLYPGAEIDDAPVS